MKQTNTMDDKKETRLLPLTKGYFALVDEDDFKRLSIYKWSVEIIHNYIRAERQIWKNGKNRKVFLSREIMNAPDGRYVDHINGDTLDNRKCNLRLCSMAENNRNVGLRTTNTSGYKGVVKSGNGFKVQIRVNSEQKYLGYFKSKTLAAMVYNLAALWYHKKFAQLNEITENMEGNY